MFLGIIDQRIDHRRPGDEQRRGLLGHDRIMARRHARRAQPGDRAEPQRHDRHQAQVRCGVVVRQVRADPPGQIGAPCRLDRLDRAAAARALDNADDRQPEIVRHLLRHQRFFADRRIGRAAAHREIVAGDDHRAAVNRRPAEHIVRRRQLDQVALVVVTRATGDRADLVKAAGIGQRVDALAYGQLARIVLSLDPLGAAELARLPLALAQLVQFRLPAHSVRPSGPSSRQCIAACGGGPSR